jgi:hypothetical protein
VIGHRPDMTVRTAGRNHQAIGHGGLAFEIDEDDILGLIVVEFRQDQAFQGRDAVVGVCRGVGGELGVRCGDMGQALMRTWRGVVLQRGSSFYSSLYRTLSCGRVRVSPPSRMVQMAALPRS